MKCKVWLNASLALMPFRSVPSGKRADARAGRVLVAPVLVGDTLRKKLCHDLVCDSFCTSLFLSFLDPHLR